MEFRYFPGDKVLNQEAHFIDTGTEKILIPMNILGTVQKIDESNDSITVTWNDVTLPHPVTTNTRNVDIRPFYIAPKT